MSGERSAFFFLNLSTIFIIILIKEYQKFRLITFIVAICCISILSLYSPHLSDRMIKEPAKNMGLIKSSDQPVIFSPIHDSLIRTAYNMIKDKSIIGHGPKMFREKCKDDKYHKKLIESLKRDKKILNLIKSSFRKYRINYFTFKVKMTRNLYLKMIKSRFNSCLLNLSSKKIETGIDEIKKKYKKKLIFSDKLICISYKKQ